MWGAAFSVSVEASLLSGHGRRGEIKTKVDVQLVRLLVLMHPSIEAWKSWQPGHRETVWDGAGLAAKAGGHNVEQCKHMWAADLRHTEHTGGWATVSFGGTT